MSEQIYDNDKFKGVRLPDFLVPYHYELKLKPDLEKYTFEGTVKILFSRRESVNDPIVLNSSELVIQEGYLEADDSTRNALTAVTYSKDSEAITLEFGVSSYPERGAIFLKFTGILNGKMKGFYRSVFDLHGKQEVLATTQFAPCDARFCFPCWDEPAKKATFKLTLQYEDVPSRDAVSNMPIVSDIVTNGVREKEFDVSPIMSTYLLAFAVGPLEYLEMFDEKKRPIRVYTTLGNKEKGRFAAEVARKSLSFYENYFGIEYPLPKLDLIAVPDLSYSAMENWGLITYRESRLLVDPANTSTASKQYVAIVVAHELAHQWFGNLVTMEWWTDLWLNEGFATFMSYLCIHDIFPEYDMWSQFVTSSYTRAMELDALHNSHPIEVPVEKPSEINEIFDVISYEKGSSVLRMLYNYIGDQDFRKGMNQYLTKFSYKNAKTENLWDSLEAASEKPIRRLMSGWTSRKGFPWLSVSVSKEGSDVNLTLSQEKFNANGQPEADDESGSSWLVPIQVITGANPNKVIDLGLLDKKEGSFRVEGSGDSWIKLNPATIGLYRTSYPVDMSRKLLSAISNKSLSSVDRLGLQNDYFALCQAGKVKTVHLLRLLGAFRSETEFSVWSSIDSCVGRLHLLLRDTDAQVKFRAFVRELYNDIFQSLTWSPRENEKHTDAMTRALVIGRLVSFGRQDVVAESIRRYKAFRNCGEPIPADVRGAVYKAVSMFGDELDFETLLESYRKTSLSEEKNRIARALGGAKDHPRIRKVIDFVLSGDVKNQDKLSAIAEIGLSHPDEAWKLLQVNKNVLLDIYGNSILISNLVKYCTENLTHESTAQQIVKFFQVNKFPGAERTIQQSLETIRLNGSWLERDIYEISAFLGVCESASLYPDVC